MDNPYHWPPCILSDWASVICDLEETRIELHENKVDDDGQIDSFPCFLNEQFLKLM